MTNNPATKHGSMLGYLLLVWSLVAPGSTGAADTAVIDAIQKRYDTTLTFRARFVQRSYLKIMGQSQEARGTVLIKKPGRMKWEYTAPDPQVLISNADALWLYLPEEKQVTKMKVESIYSSNTPALFLAGKGKLTKSFDVEKITPRGNRLVVALKPKEKDHNVDRLILYVDKNNYQIVGSSVYDKLGNKTDMLFSDIQVNPEISDEEFHFTVPKGVELIDFSAGPESR